MSEPREPQSREADLEPIIGHAPNGSREAAIDASRDAPPAKSLSNPEQGWAPIGTTLWLFVTAGILVVGQMYVALPMLTQMAASLGTTPGTLTGTATVFGFAYALGFLFGGPMADRFGPRTMIMAGLCTTGLLTAAIAAAPTGAILIVMRGVQGFCAAMFLPSALSYVTARIRPQARVLLVSCVTTSAFAAAIVLQTFGQLMVGSFGWRVVFLISGAMIAMLGIAASFTMQRTERFSSNGLTAAFRAMPSLLARPAMLLLYLASFVLLGAFAAMYVAIAVAGPVEVVGSPATLLALRLSGLPAMIAIPLLAPVMKRLPALARVLSGLVGGSAAAAAAALLSGSAVQLGLVLLVFLAALVMAAPALVEMIATGAPDNPGVATALYGFAMFLGASVGSQLVGSSGLAFGPLQLWIAASLFTGAGMVAVSSRLVGATR